MPAEVTSRVHTLARCANANRGLTFTDRHGNDLDVLYPDDDDTDSDYDPDLDASSGSSDDDGDSDSDSDSDFNPSDDASTDLSAGPHPTELAGVNEPANTTGVDDRTPGVTSTTPGVADNTPGVTKTPKLEEYVNELEAELDAEIAALDNGYSPASHNKSNTDDDLDDSYMPINHNKVAAANRDAT